MLQLLPEDCIARVISFTSPADACRLSSVSRTFKSAADSDVVWECFLPADYESIIPESPSSSSCLRKKELYMRLCDHFIVMEGGKKSFSPDKRSGKKCYMLAARDLKIACVDRHWSWFYDPDARFPEVAHLDWVLWLEIRGRISTSLLSPATVYAVYLVYKLDSENDESTREYEYSPGGFGYIPVQASVGIVGSEIGRHQRREIYLDVPRRNDLKIRIDIRERSDLLRKRKRKDIRRRPNVRRDGWLEMVLGHFTKEGDDDCNCSELEISVFEIETGLHKDGITIQGIEIRPKEEEIFTL